MVIRQPSLPSTPLIAAVLGHGSDKWYQLASQMGFCHSEIISITSDKLNFADKLLATINAMLQKNGCDNTERILLKACREIQPSNYGAVSDDVENFPQAVEHY
jgi:hypothetical protein